MSVFRARRLPSEAGNSGWEMLLGCSTAPQLLSGKHQADVAIIGGGFAGLSAARRIGQIDPDVKVVVLEAGRFAGGPAGRNSGFMIDLPHDLASESYAGSQAQADRQQIDMNRTAITFARAAAAEYGMDNRVFAACGKINGAASDSGHTHNQHYAKHLANLQETHQWLDARDMHALTGTHYYRSGLYTPGTVLLQPAAYIRQLVAGLRRRSRSVQFYENSAVVSMEADSMRWKLKTDKGSVQADRVIMATNGHAESFGFFRRRLLHVVTYASMTQPFEPGRLNGQRAWGLTPADPMGTTVRRIETDKGSRIVVRTQFSYNPSMRTKAVQLTRVGRLHDQKFVERFPMLADVAMASRWGGHLCLSWNGVPAHGEIEKGLFSAVCQNGLGTAKGTLAGVSAAEMALGRKSRITAYMGSMEPPRRLPPSWLTTLGVGAMLQWKQWRAGRE